MNKQQIELAITTGIELLGEKSEISIPMKMNDGVFYLRQLLMLIGSAKVTLGFPEQIAPAPAPAPAVAEAVAAAVAAAPPPPPKPPAPPKAVKKK